jgi:uracil-DNA glycosylase
LHRYGWASAPASRSADDGLRLQGCRITNAVKCVPPLNKPTPAEIATCSAFLAAELASLDEGAVILALGAIAHGAVLRGYGLKLSAHAFAHGSEHPLPGGRVLFDSYHCSRYNTQTRRLTTEMFRDVFGRATARARIAGSQ